MRFKTGLVLVTGEDAIKPNELTVKQQKELLEKHPHLKRFVVTEQSYEDDKSGNTDNVDTKPKPKRGRGRKRKSSSDQSE